MPKIRVLIVDDSVVVRRLLSDLLAADPNCEVVGTAANGKIAIQKIPQVNPDIVTLDVEMPEMDGLETLAAIRKTHPRLPVIMFSALTEKAADATLKALALGATDYVTKPTASSATSAMDQVRDQLIPKIRCLCGVKPDVRQAVVGRTASQVRAKLVVPPLVRASRVDVVAIGCSTGGPNALAVLLPKLAQDFPVPIVITQHMPPLFTRMLAERMNASTSLRVREAQGGEVLEHGYVYIAPGDFHMDVRREGTAIRLALHQAPPENSCRPAVDVMLRSVVSVYGAGSLGVILTGMGQDGMRGCELIREAGGHVVVQDEATSVVWGMPGAVARAGLADVVLPMDQIAAEVTRRVAGGGAQAGLTRAASRP
jgi:two-component system chemotaxis response regulator CheB